MGYASEQDNENVSSNLQDEHDAKEFFQKEKKHKCTHPNCQAMFARPSKLERHMRQHTGERPYVCNELGCTKSYSSSCHLKRHSKTHDLVQEVYECPDCSQMSVTLSNLKRHYKEQHGKDKVFCAQCGKMFNKKYDLTKHRDLVHLKVASYKCDKCDKSFPDISRFKRHQKNHEKSYLCPISGCSEIFYKWSLLRKHTKAKHRREYKCDKCDKVFFAKASFKSHSVIHSKDRMVIQCSYEKCQKVYLSKSSLDQHIKTRHLGQKFYCDICSIGLTAKRRLIHHIKLHEITSKNNEKIITKKIQRNKRKDTGIPKKSVIGKLIGWNFPHSIEKLLLERETIKDLKSTDKSSNNAEIEPAECTS